MSETTPLSEYANGSWRIEWDRATEPTSRVTTLAAMAWYADNFDPEASVTRLD
jgi:hypothetical protein